LSTGESLGPSPNTGDSLNLVVSALLLVGRAAFGMFAPLTEDEPIHRSTPQPKALVDGSFRTAGSSSLRRLQPSMLDEARQQKTWRPEMVCGQGKHTQLGRAVKAQDKGRRVSRLV
jgi:hypothetical protein